MVSLWLQIEVEGEVFVVSLLDLHMLIQVISITSVAIITTTAATLTSVSVFIVAAETEMTQWLSHVVIGVEQLKQ